MPPRPLPAPQFRLDSVSRVAMPAGWALPEHVHPEYCQMLVLLSGAMEVRLGGEKISARAGEVLLYPDGVAHAERNAGHEAVEAIYLGFVLDRQAYPELRYHRPDPAGRIGYLAHWMLERFPPASAADRQVLSQLLGALLAEWGTPAVRGQDDLAGLIRPYVRARLTEGLTLDDLARAAGLSRFRFAHAFRQATGQTPMRFVQQVRVEAAYGLLMTTQLPLRAIAREVGFADAFHLSKVFRRVLGKSPRDCRRGR